MKMVDESHAFDPGCDVWFIAHLDGSSWARRIDWYLNFQLLRSEAHRPREISIELADVLETWSMDAPVIDVSAKAPLMVASHELLPNTTTVVANFETTADWAKICHRTLGSLNTPRFRVFLPDGVLSEAFRKAWPGEMPASLEVVAGTSN